MKKLFKISAVFFICSIILSCAKTFYSPDAFSIAHTHKVIAILSPAVSITSNKKVNVEALVEQQKTESVNIQKEIYSWLLKRKAQGKIKIEIQDIETTNALFNKSEDIRNLSPAEVCDVLNVDGLITSSFGMTKPMSEGGAAALGLLFGVWAPTNEVVVFMSIHDKGTKKIIWNYSHKFSGSIGSTPARLVDGLMRRASKTTPYMQ